MIVPLLERLRTITAPVAESCANPECRHQQGKLRGLMRRGLRLNGQWFCNDECFRAVLTSEIAQMSSRRIRDRVHRMPIGLILLRRGAIAECQLESALESQREGGADLLGTVLAERDGIEEREILRALAEQTGLPLFTGTSWEARSEAAIPRTIAVQYRMLPLQELDAPRRLFVGVAGRVLPQVLMAVERQLDMRIEPCLVERDLMDSYLEQRRGLRDERELTFETSSSALEMVNVVETYCRHFQADEVRTVICGDYLWARLLDSKRPMDLLFRISHAAN